MESFEQVRTPFTHLHLSWLLITDNTDDSDVDYAAFFLSGNKESLSSTTRSIHCCDFETIGFEDLNQLGLQNATLSLFKAARMTESSYERIVALPKKIVHDLGFHTIQGGAFIML